MTILRNYHFLCIIRYVKKGDWGGRPTLNFFVGSVTIGLKYDEKKNLQRTLTLRDSLHILHFRHQSRPEGLVKPVFSYLSVLVSLWVLAVLKDPIRFQL